MSNNLCQLFRRQAITGLLKKQIGAQIEINQDTLPARPGTTSATNLLAAGSKMPGFTAMGIFIVLWCDHGESRRDAALWACWRYG